MSTPNDRPSAVATGAESAAMARLDGTVLRRRAVHSIWTSLVRSLSGSRRVVTLVALVLAWCALWGSFTFANVAAGVVVGVGALTVGFGGQSRGGIRPLPLVRFTLLVGRDLVTSTFSVMKEVLTPTDHTEEGIIAVDLPIESVDHLLLLYVAITVTPGTAVVAAEADGRRVYLHVLHCDRRESIVKHVIEIAELAVRALPTTYRDRPVAEPVTDPLDAPTADGEEATS